MYDIEKGHVRIANELLEDICQLPLSGNCYKVLFWAMRNSYGYNRKNTNPASMKEIAEAVKLNKSSAHLSVTILLKNEVLKKLKDGSFFFNKYAIKKALTVQPTGRVASSPLDGKIVQPTGRFVQPTGRSIYIRRKDNLKTGEGEGRGTPPPAPGPSDLEKEGKIFEAKIMAVAGAYADSKNIKLEAREVYLKTRKVYFPAKDLLALCQGNVKRAIAAIIDHAAHYKRNEKPDWKFEWILEDFYKWDEARIQNEKEE